MSRRSRGGRPRRLPVAPSQGATPVASPGAPAAERPVAGQGQAVAPPPSSEPASPASPSTLAQPTRPIAGSGSPGAGCTAPQLRRFIKSRVYVPLHELRRRFGIDGADDDVHAVELESGRIFVGLPAPEARLLEELLRGGDVGFELSRDPSTPIVIGVYPMRPVARA